MMNPVTKAKQAMQNAINFKKAQKRALVSALQKHAPQLGMTEEYTLEELQLAFEAEVSVHIEEAIKQTREHFDNELKNFHEIAMIGLTGKTKKQRKTAFDNFVGR